jgi:hypothetical protein
MHARIRLVGLATAFVLVLALANTTVATAAHISTSSRTFRIVWNPLTLFSSGGVFGPIRCPVTLEGSFHSATIRKTAGALVGYITRGTTVANACTGGTLTVIQTSLPWHVRYRAFTGTLPRIEGMQLAIVGMSFRIAPLTCVATTTATEPLVVRAELSSGSVTGLRAMESFLIPIEEPMCLVGGSGSFQGTGTMTVLGTTFTAVTIRLI